MGSVQKCQVPRCPPGSAGCPGVLQAMPCCAGCPGVPWAMPSCAGCPGVPRQCPAAPMLLGCCSAAQMLVPSQAAGFSVRRALHRQQRQQEARLPCEQTAPSFIAKNSPPGCGPAWKSPLQPLPVHVYSARGGGTHCLPPAHHPCAQPPRQSGRSWTWFPGSPPAKTHRLGWGGWQTPKKHWVCLREEQPPVMS